MSRDEVAKFIEIDGRYVNSYFSTPVAVCNSRRNACLNLYVLTNVPEAFIHLRLGYGKQEKYFRQEIIEFINERCFVASLLAMTIQKVARSDNLERLL